MPDTPPPKSGGSSSDNCPESNGLCCFDHGPKCCHCGAVRPHEHGWGPWELRPTLGDNVEASYCACGASKARTRDPEPPAPGSSPRPPYAVAYAVQGGALYEVALPGDATATAEGGRLVITHAGMPVTGIVRIAPMRTEEGA